MGLKTNNLLIALSDKEKRLLSEITEKLGVSMSAFIRLATFKKLREEELILKSTKNEVEDNGRR